MKDINNGTYSRKTGGAAVQRIQHVDGYALFIYDCGYF